jgi:hypothetical protein
LHVVREHGVGGGQHGAQQQRRSPCQVQHLCAEPREQRHRDDHRDQPEPQRQDPHGAVERHAQSQADSEQRHEQRDLREHAQHMRVAHDIELQQIDARRAEQKADQQVDHRRADRQTFERGRRDAHEHEHAAHNQEPDCFVHMRGKRAARAART